MKQVIKEWSQKAGSLALLSRIDQILTKWEKMGYKLTLRQLYYQLVSRDVIANTLEQYNRIIRIVGRGRLAGFIDWAMIEDRVRIPKSNTHWASPNDILRAAASSYYRSRWVGQDNYVEVWCEKDAVSNIIEPVCRKWDVLFLANRGYSSQTAMYDAYERLTMESRCGKSVFVIYLGDHDPSGMDMTHDITGRLGLFLAEGEDIDFDEVDRIALNKDQIDKYNPPENPAKVTDSRYKKYVIQYGPSSWELDALDPPVLSGIVEKAILQYVDQEKFNAVAEEEREHKEKLEELADSTEF